MSILQTRRRFVGWMLLGATVCILMTALLFKGSQITAFWNEALAPAQADDKGSRHQVAAGDGQSQPVTVKTVQPTRKDLKRSTTQPAQIEGYEKTDVFAKATGYLGRFGQARHEDGDEVDLDIGDSVAKDQVLAELWIPEMDEEQAQKAALVEQAEAELGQAVAAYRAVESMVEAVEAKIAAARADVIRAQAEVKLRESENRRYQQLSRERAAPAAQADEKLNAFRAAEASVTAAEQAFVSAQANLKVQRAQVQRASADSKAAESRIKVARANLEQTQVLVRYATIRAPFDGLITRRWFDNGAFIQSAATGKADPLFTIVRTDRLRIIADIPESDAAWVRPGQAAVLSADAARGRQFTGKIARLAGALEAATRTMRVQVELDKPSSDLRPGMFGSVSITLGDTPGALMVPASALVTSAGKTSVTIVEEGQARRREVTLGFNDGVNVQVTQGLEGDEHVILEGKNLVREGQAVRVAN